jgi:hypothetical protein
VPGSPQTVNEGGNPCIDNNETPGRSSPFPDHPANRQQAAKLVASTATPRNGKPLPSSTKMLASPGASSKMPTTSTITPLPGLRNTKTPPRTPRYSRKVSRALASTTSTPKQQTVLSLQYRTSSAPPSSPNIHRTHPATAPGSRKRSSMQSRKEQHISPPC